MGYYYSDFTQVDLLLIPAAMVQALVMVTASRER